MGWLGQKKNLKISTVIINHDHDNVDVAFDSSDQSFRALSTLVIWYFQLFFFIFIDNKANLNITHAIVLRPLQGRYR